MSSQFIIEVDKDLEEIMPMFLENRKKDVISLKDFIETNNFSEIEIIAHKLAGNAGGYGLKALGEIGSKMELAAQNSDMKSIQDQFENYRNYITNLNIKYV